MPYTIPEDIIDQIYQSSEIRSLILNRLHHFRETLIDLAPAHKSAFKVAFGVWDFSRWGLRMMGDEDDPYYLDGQIDRTAWDDAGISAVTPPNRSYLRDPDQLKSSWSAYLKQVFPRALAELPKKGHHLNFRKSMPFDTATFDEAVVFPFANYNHMPFFSWGGYKLFLAVFFKESGNEKDLVAMIDGFETQNKALSIAWEHFETQLFERAFFQSCFRFDLDIPQSLLISLLSIYRPIIAWIDGPEGRHVLSFGKTADGYKYYISETEGGEEYYGVTQRKSLRGTKREGDIRVDYGVKLAKGILMPDHLNKGDWSFFLLNVPEILPGHTLNIIIPAYTPGGSHEHLKEQREEVVDRLLRMRETLRYLFVHAQLIHDWGRDSLNAHTKAAIAAIMGRNMSHNLGSHAIGYVAAEFAQYTQHDMVRLLSYIQKRMDFIAQISTSPPSWCLSLPWNDEISDFPRRYKDESKPNRPKWKDEPLDPSSAQAVGEKPYAVLSDFARQFGLLDNIARSDNSRYRPSKEIEEMSANGGKLRPLKLSIRVNCAKATAKGTPPVFYPDIPHGQIGAHALYSILENLLRNAAKYGAGKAEPLEFSVNIRNRWNEHSGNPRHSEWQHEFYQVAVSDNQPLTGSVADAVKLRDQLNAYLEMPIINRATAELEAGQWGMKEIKICAAYLRLIAQEDIDRKFDHFKSRSTLSRSSYAPGKEPPLVEVTMRRIAKNKFVLDTIFYLLRAKEALFVGTLQPDDKAKFESAGIEFWLWQKMQKHIEEGGALRHQFLVLSGGITTSRWKWIEENLDALPYRIFIVGEGEFSEETPQRVQRNARRLSLSGFEDKTEPHQWHGHLWDVWCERYGDGELLVRWSGDFQGHVPGLIRWIDQSPSQGESAEQHASQHAKDYVYDHRKNAHDATKADSPGQTLYSHARFHESLDNGPAKSLLDEVGKAGLDDLSGKSRVALRRLLEASAISVAILDERIFERADETPQGIGTGGYETRPDDTDRLTFGKAWRKRGVHLLDHGYDQIQTSKGETLPARVGSKGLFAQMPLPGIDDKQVREGLYDVLVVHQGVLDKLRNQSQELKEQTGREGDIEECWDRLRDRARVVVIDTGRGKPPEATRLGLRWLEFSNLSEAVFSGGKLQLATLLFALQAKGGEAKPGAPRRGQTETAKR